MLTYFGTWIFLSFTDFTASAAAFAITADLPAPAVPMTSRGVGSAVVEVMYSLICAEEQQIVSDMRTMVQ